MECERHPETSDERAADRAAVAAAVAASGTRDPELLTMLLLQRAEPEDALGGAVEEIRAARPYLFFSSRPAFAASCGGRTLTAEDETVARRYDGNPWYRRRNRA